MAKLRDEVRSAFERDQSALGDVRDARQRLVHNALTAPVRDSHRLQWATAIAAVLIAAIVITTFALIRGNIRPQPVPGLTPRANASPTPLRKPINVPDSTPLLIYRDPANFDQVDAITWDGKTSGTFGFDSSAYSANPAGNLFASGGTIVDRRGNLVASGFYGTKFFAGTWADDELHFCQMVPFDYLGASGVPATLQLVVPGQPPKDIARIGMVYEQAFIRVAACSVEFDRAVVVQSGGQGVGTAQYWVVQLSTGKTLWSHDFRETTTPPIQVTSSRDGRTIAESQSSGSTTSTIFGPDGTVTNHLDGSVSAFSWDGSLAIVDSGDGGGPARLVRLTDGATVWAGPTGAGRYVYQYAAQPDGGAVAIGVHDLGNPDANGDNKGFDAVDFYVISPVGRVVIQMTEIYW